MKSNYAVAILVALLVGLVGLTALSSQDGDADHEIPDADYVVVPGPGQQFDSPADADGDLLVPQELDESHLDSVIRSCGIECQEISSDLHLNCFAEPATATIPDV